eukprot:TRINITY_DN4578_c0_g1_i1.p1 TRINITY_DN4578_c0_g1~~TRINITY_DN4578_c0_g1_i1.p1  ORF type:complete len:226 (+),score=49.99 TRINITY_DN4578_c0_g1_i1:84-680(+)
MSNLALTLGIGISAFITYRAAPTNELFPWHPTLMAIGLLTVMTYGILVFSKQDKTSHKDKVWTHFLCNATAAALTAGGFAAIYINKNLRGKEHYTSYHGQVGLITTIMVVSQALVSSTMLYPAWLIKQIGTKNYNTFKKMHRLGGTATYMLVVGEMILSYYTKWMGRQVSDEVWPIFPLATVAMAAAVVYKVSPRLGA